MSDQHTRKSSRLKAKETTVYDDDDLSDEEVEVKPAVDTSNLGKRKRVVKATSAGPPKAGTSSAGAGDTTSAQTAQGQRPPAKRARGKRGVLQRLVEMPLDLLFEIFGKLDPIDVLQMARTTKELRAILMSRSAIMIWKEALGNVPGLPPCPEDLTEPQWVDLLFGKSCQKCSRSLAHQTTAWMARFRGCTRCMQNKFTYTYDNGNRENREIEQLLPIIPRFILNIGPRAQRGYRYQASVIEQLTAECRGVKPEAKAAWIKKKLEESSAKLAHSKLCERWQNERDKQRADSQDAIREARKKIILDKIRDLGYETEIKKNLWLEPVLHQLLRKDVTDRVWVAAEPVVIQALDRRKRERIEIENMATMKARHQLIGPVHQKYRLTRPIGEAIIPVPNLFLTSEVQDLLNNTPMDQEMTLSDFDGILEEMPGIAARWEEEGKGKLLESMITLSDPVVAGPVPTMETLNLATSVFKCEHCSKAMHARQAIGHACRRYNYPNSPLVSKFYSNTSLHPWSTFQFAKDCSARIARFLVLFGHDPKTMAPEELDKLDPIVECVKCKSYSCGRLIMDWRSVMSHSCQEYYRTLDPETEVYVRRRMDEVQCRERNNNINKLVCTRCRFEGIGTLMRQHLATEHSISDPADDDIHDTTEPKGRPVLWYFKFGVADKF
ncbi:hypothetical protein FA15DRAFT_668129 [Coprinopsis marcescibilis]|uniref:F-box domain-containing protein n=1 Tax=Coprinopsis marcescibilis TaxID=230819 RepID=A0A5C3L040_COPMA|nr:hypothetical protein FA15DRAFT_668129 [Coprinopsis marcescibilis]